MVDSEGLEDGAGADPAEDRPATEVRFEDTMDRAVSVPDGPRGAELGPAPRSVFGSLDELLRRPGAVIARAGEASSWADVASLLVGAALAFAAYGLAAGAFAGAGQSLVVAVKAPLIAMTSLCLCLPSLYVIGALSGAEISLRWILHIGAALVALLGVLLVGFLPVAWLFSVSSRYLGFLVLMHVAIWFCALVFGGRFLSASLRARGGGGSLVAWVLLFGLVSFQVATQLRPVLMPAESFWPRPEKQFFVEHFASCFGRQPG